MKNHDYVPDLLIFTIANINKRNCYDILHQLIKLKMIQYLKNKDSIFLLLILANGYRLTFFGYDTLSLRSLLLLNVIAEIGSKMGVGKESDIYIARNLDGERIILKFHRLGRNSFRKIKEKRDYFENRTHASWIYLSRLSATKEYQFMTILRDNKFPVPIPIAHNRHCVVMSLVDGFTLNHTSAFDNPATKYEECRDLIIRLAENGLIHCDFNEFNLMVQEDLSIYMIDFPQMVSIDHPNAGWYFERDFDCIKQYFSKRFHFSVNDNLSLGDIERQNFLDVDVCASGFDKNKKNHKFELAQEIADVDGLDNSEENCDIISISHTFEQLELISDDTLHDSGHA
ncbi:hypothetical protein HZS_3380, partial [Henneguya salminicola]